MRFIYLSKTHEKQDFGTMAYTINYFKDFYKNPSKPFNFNAGPSKIGKSTLALNEDNFFIRIDNAGVYRIVAYCKNASKVISNQQNADYTHHFLFDVGTLKIFENGIDLAKLDKFVYENSIRNKPNFFTSGKGHIAWRRISDKNEANLIMDYFKRLVFEECNRFKSY